MSNLKIEGKLALNPCCACPLNTPRQIELNKGIVIYVLLQDIV